MGNLATALEKLATKSIPTQKKDFQPETAQVAIIKKPVRWWWVGISLGVVTLVLASLWAGPSGLIRPSPTNTSALQPTPAPLSGAMETQNPQMAGNVPQQITSVIPALATPKSPAAAAVTPGQNSPGENLVYNEDFEDGFARGFEFGPGNWAVVDDGTGNKVLKSNNNKEWTESIFGPDKFSDGVIEFRFRILQENKSSQSFVLYLAKNLGITGQLIMSV